MESNEPAQIPKNRDNRSDLLPRFGRVLSRCAPRYLIPSALTAVLRFLGATGCPSGHALARTLLARAQVSDVPPFAEVGHHWFPVFETNSLDEYPQSRN